MGNYGEGALTNRFFPCLGNHDWSTPGAQPYLDYFELPCNERFYLQDSSIDPRLLHDGVNTIAVQLHQASAASTDLSFDLELVGH